ncbi:MAG TPA: hypothetical protein VGJ84_12730 [Polyangiaceae bacterium]
MPRRSHTVVFLIRFALQKSAPKELRSWALGVVAGALQRNPNIPEAARDLGMSRATMYRWVARRDIRAAWKQGTKKKQSSRPLPRIDEQALRVVSEMLHSCSGDVRAAARKLGIGHATLYRWLAGQGILRQSLKSARRGRKRVAPTGAARKRAAGKRVVRKPVARKGIARKRVVRKRASAARRR